MKKTLPMRVAALVLTLLPMWRAPMAVASEPLVPLVRVDTMPRVAWMRVDSVPRVGLLTRLGRGLGRFVRGFNDIDTAYIEPQRYRFTAMAQSTTTYEVYRLGGEGQSVTFAPDLGYRVGPYVGWRWVFLGWAFDVGRSGDGDTRQEYDLSLYSSRIGADLYYRRSGSGYHIRRIDLGGGVDTRRVEGVAFSGLRSSVRGVNLYVILNHRRFSYPAAFSQSTRQLRSAGSPLVGVAWTEHRLSVDWDALDRLLGEHLTTSSPQALTTSKLIDPALRFSEVSYTDVSLSGGYAYNWVFAHGWLLAGSVSMAVAYNRNTGAGRLRLGDFSFSKVGLDGIGRFGLVYNTGRWFAGASAIVHAYNYRGEGFATNNVFGSVNVYLGVNFGKN